MGSLAKTRRGEWTNNETKLDSIILCFAEDYVQFLSTLQIQDHGIRLGNPDDDLHQLQQQQEVMKLTLPFLQKTLMRIYREIKSDPQFLELHISKEDTNALLKLITHDRVTLPKTMTQNGVSSTCIPEFLVTLVFSLIFVI